MEEEPPLGLVMPRVRFLHPIPKSNGFRLQIDAKEFCCYGIPKEDRIVVRELVGKRSFVTSFPRVMVEDIRYCLKNGFDMLSRKTEKEEFRLTRISNFFGIAAKVSTIGALGKSRSVIIPAGDGFEGWRLFHLAISRIAEIIKINNQEKTAIWKKSLVIANKSFKEVTLDKNNNHIFVEEREKKELHSNCVDSSNHTSFSCPILKTNSTIDFDSMLEDPEVCRVRRSISIDKVCGNRESERWSNDVSRDKRRKNSSPKLTETRANGVDQPIIDRVRSEPRRLNGFRATLDARSIRGSKVDRVNSGGWKGGL